MQNSQSLETNQSELHPFGDARPLRSAVAIVGGYLIAYILSAFTFQALAAVFPNLFGASAPATPSVWMYIFTYLLSFIYTAIAGFTTAVIAKRREMVHAGALAGFMVVLGVATSISLESAEHRYMELLFTAVGVCGVLFGAKIRVRQLTRNR